MPLELDEFQLLQEIRDILNELLHTMQMLEMRTR
jgi:hypothetical protein